LRGYSGLAGYLASPLGIRSFLIDARPARIRRNSIQLRENYGRAAPSRHMRASPLGRQRRPLGTTSRRGGRDFCLSTKAASALPARRSRLTQRGGRTRSLGLPSDPRDNPCRRQGDQVVAPSSTGRRLLVEDDHAAFRGRRYLAARWRGGRRRRPVVLSQGAHARMGVPVGRGPLGDAEDHQETVDPRLGLRPLSPAVAVIRTRPDGALACRRQQARTRRTLGHSHSRESGGAAPCFPRGAGLSSTGLPLPVPSEKQVSPASGPFQLAERQWRAAERPSAAGPRPFQRPRVGWRP
jgi:hypothetical protein